MVNNLCIFDYHGTLIWAIDVHDAAYARTVEEIYEVKGSIHDVWFAASTIEDVTIAIAKNKGVSNEVAESRRHLILPSYEKHFVDALENEKMRVLPGIPGLLHSLQENNIPLALYTGDSFTTVGAILRKSGLDKYFPEDMRSSGTDETRDRVELLKLAIEKANRKYNTTFPHNRVCLFDDSVRGIEAGKSLGIVTIGVATGPEGCEELQKRFPTHLFKDFSKYEEVLKIVLG